MAGNKKKKANPPYEEAASSSGVPIKILLAMVCIGIALLIIYLAFAVPQAGTAMLGVKNIIRGISGDIPIVLALIFLWIGTLCIGSAKGKGINAFHIIVYSIMFLSVFAAVHVFSAETIIAQLNVRSYAQFIVTSFQRQIGGGLLGSFMAYFLYEYIGSYAGCGVCVLIILLSLVATGRASKIFDWGKTQAEESKRARSERAAKRESEKDHLFDEFDETPVQRRGLPQNAKQRNQGTPEQQARRRQANKPMERVSNPQKKVAYIPNRGDADPKKLRDVTQAFYDPNSDDDASRGNKRKNSSGIEIPSPIRDLRESKKGRKDQGNKSRFADPDSKRKAPRTENNASEETNSEVSSVSSDVMAVVARESAKQRNAAPDDLETGERIKNDTAPAESDDIFANITEDVQEEDSSVFEPVRYQPTAQPKKRVEEGTRGLFEGSISRSSVKEKHEKMTADFAETDDPEYNYPPIDLLERGDKEDLVRKHEALDKEKAAKLIDTLKSFGITTTLTGIAHGPAVTRFELQPDAGIKVSRITSLADDIALSLAAESVRIEAPIPGKPAVGVEIPNEKVEMVRLRDVLESNEALHNASKIAIGLGKDNSGRYVVADIAKMPHVLIAGQTGSGKSVCINSIITSILYRATPEDVRMILIDPKVVELSIYNDIPHLIAPVVTDPKKAASALQWAVSEMLDRYKKFSAKGVRNIKGYNAALSKDEKKMPQMVIIIDELADLMMAAPGEVEDSICRIAQLARAAGMHLVIATQRPSTNVITGIIKANIPTRIAFAVASQIDSRVMIDYGGAEKLLGNGDMLFVPNGGKSLRVQGTWVSDAEVESVVDYIKERCDTNYDEDVQEKIENSVKSDAEIEDSNAELDDRLAEAVEIVVEAGQASVSMLQRRMRVGYARAGRLIDEMQKRGIVSEADGAKPRSVLMTREQFKQTFGEDI